MYNYFANDKREKENIIDKLSKKYDDKVKNFIFSMANDPVKINDYIGQISNAREKHMEDEQTRLVGKKFVFNTYQTDKERINNMEKVKSTLSDKKNSDNLYQNVEPTSPIKKSSKINFQWKNLQQPNLRFKPKNDYERIIDSLDNYGNLKKQMHKKWFEEQKSILNLEEAARKKEEFQEYNKKGQDDKDNIYNIVLDDIDETTKQRNEDESAFDLGFFGKTLSKSNTMKNFTKSFYSPNFTKKLKDTIHIRKILKKYTNNQQKIKTHFKGVQEFTQKLNDPYSPANLNWNRNHNSKGKSPLNFSMMKHSHSTKNFLLTSPSFHKENKQIDNSIGKYDFYSKTDSERQDESDHEYSMISKVHEYDIINNNPNKKRELLRKDKDENLAQKLQFLKKLSATSTKEKVSQIDFINKLKFKRLDTNTTLSTDRDPLILFKIDGDGKEDTVCIDGEVFLKSNVDKIAKKILKKCNIEHDKNLNNRTSLKTGNGKLMITNGMSLSDFKRKYKLA